ncbi:riboflavin synthase [Niallia taxi]|uniref:riboflavin synthase n=1 Tax=Niallia taxi TaxID=2499688 RepID=UPI002040190D|nr:riboflavin synthase [Niallia taxi]MCM3215678.1 riboflavin synthase [Niallia taxi]
MFTGIVEETGIVKNISKTGKTLVLAIQAKTIMDDMRLGDSISVNGVCLTVTSFKQNEFSADVMPETYKDTSLSRLTNGSLVNLERAMAANGRFGGHFVTGHIDGVGTILSRKPIENSISLEIEIPEAGTHLVLEKGSIAIDGTSLTIFETKSRSICVSIIPHTTLESIVGKKQVGDIVNLEFDMMAKYFYSFMNREADKNQSSKITPSFLKDNGFY